MWNARSRFHINPNPNINPNPQQLGGDMQASDALEALEHYVEREVQAHSLLLPCKRGAKLGHEAQSLLREPLSNFSQARRCACLLRNRRPHMMHAVVTLRSAFKYLSMLVWLRCEKCIL